MAIPHNLVTKLEEGNAQFRTYVWGYGPSGILCVKPNTYIVIIGFRFWHYLNVLPDDMDDLQTVWENSVKQIRFRSHKSDNHFIITQPIRSMIGGAVPGQTQTYTTWGYSDYDDLYLVHEKNVQMDIVNPPPNNDISVFGSPYPSNANSNVVPFSTGTDATPAPVAVFHDISVGSGPLANFMESVPVSRKFSKTDGFGYPLRSDQIVYPVQQAQLDTRIDTGFGHFHRSLPKVELRYIEVDIMPTERLKSSG